MAKPSGLENVKAGTKLTTSQSKQLGRLLEEIIDDAGTRRNHILLIHDSLQDVVGGFLLDDGWDVQYEVPFNRGEFEAERDIFDIVAEKGKYEIIVEVKDEVKSRDLGQVFGYIVATQLSKMKCGVYLATDVLNYDDLLSGTVGAMVAELMTKYGMGIILADKHWMVTFSNYEHLTILA